MAEETPIVSFKDAHEIGRLFYDIQQQFKTVPKSGYGMYIIRKDYFPNTPQAYTAVDYFGQQYTGDISGQYYIRFGRFLDFLSEKIVPNINYDPNIKLIKIDTNVKTNIIHVLPKIVSADPKVCCIRTAFTNNNIVYFYAPYASEFIIPFNDSNIKGTYGYVMNIYFNMDWILTKIDELKDDKGKISLYSLLDALCKGFNESTGHYNKLEPVVDSDETIINILDNVSLPDKNAILKSSLLSSSFEDISTEIAIFDTYGYYTGTKDNAYGLGTSHAGFIKDLSFTTTVSPELATMITVGSTKQGYIKGADATALSRMNNGLEDRFKKQITNADEVKDEVPPPLNIQYSSSINAFDTYIQKLGTSQKGSNPNYDEKSVNVFKNTQTQFVEYQQAQQTQEAQKLNPTAASPNSGFLPFDLSLTMDGLSGMKVYQSFYIDTNFLPTNYPGTLEFLIKGITHKIEGNQWTTNIESMAVPKNPFALTGSDNPVDEASRNSNRGEANFVAESLIYSTKRGGSSRIIEGITYKNGEIPESKLRSITNPTKYKGAISSDSGRVRLYDKASIALDKLIAAAEKSGITVKINSAYRTVEDQKRVYAENCPGGICKILTAKPGTSNHGFGLAVDFATPELARIKNGDKLYEWLVKNGATYGFARIKKETWHWEYQL
jgi:LAS superfamily LD-carboxypeptidase LdcB